MRLLLVTVIFCLTGPAALAQTPVVAAGGVLNAASSDKTGLPLAPGSLVSIYGTNLVSASASAGSIPLPYNLSDASVTFNGVKAPMLNTAHLPAYDQLNVQIPWEAVAFAPPATNGTVRMVVTRNGVDSDPYTVPVTTASPGIFTTGFGPGQAIAYGNADGIIAGPVSAVSHPIKIGDPLVILATGLGPVDQSVASGDVPKPGVLVRALTTPIVLVGNIPALVYYAGLSPQFAGVYQINIVLGAATPTGDAVPVQIYMNGVYSRGDVTIAVAQ